MIKILPETKDNFVALRLSGKLDDEDYTIIVPLLEKQIEAHGSITLFWEMVDFDGWTVPALWADTKFDLKHASDLDKVAMVGDKKWQELLKKLMRPFTSARLRFFESAERESALQWCHKQS
jgi:hypothetical protein